MALRQDINLRNSLAEAFGALFGEGTVRVYSGVQPDSANDAAPGTLLATITLPATAFTSASNGMIGKNGTWSTTASTSGTAGWARIIAPTGERFDILVTEPGGGGDAIINDANIIQGGDVVINSCNYAVPSGE